jgi:hypothetical protein
MRKLSKNNLKKYRSKSKKYRSKSKKYRSKSKKYRSKSKKYKFRAKNDGMNNSSDERERDLLPFICEEEKLELNATKGDYDETEELKSEENSKKRDDELSRSGKGEHVREDIKKKFNSVLTNSSIKHLYLGDSFIKIFSGYTSKTMFILSSSGKTAKGLHKEESEIRTNLLRNEILEKLECLILHFGSVDIHFSYFYTLSKLDDTIVEKISKSNDDFVKYNDDYISEIVKNYVLFINEIKKKKKSKLKIFVLIPYYSPVQDEDVLENLKRYVFKNDYDVPLRTYSNKIQKKLFSFNNRKSLVDLFDKKMKNIFTDDDSVKIISINDQIIGISRQYLLKDKIDIHLNQTVSNKYTEMLQKCGLS